MVAHTYFWPNTSVFVNVNYKNKIFIIIWKLNKKTLVKYLNHLGCSLMGMRTKDQVVV